MKKPTAFGKYFLLERINVGGMAEVFRAKAFGVEGFERLVAVKRILSNIAEDKEFIRMFIEEAKLSVQLNHANIAQIFDLGVVDSSYYIALEHVHGRDLRGIFDRCRQLGEAMPVAQACFVAMKVCEGLDYAHNKRDQSGRELSLVHRDVSPQNILVSFEGEVKLIDFGIAKAAGSGSKTQAGILKGKFGYMSPEQVRGLQVDRRSDVFSCGIVLYELLTGERLFVGESDFSTLEKVRNVEILPPSTYNRKIPDELERIVLKALTKDVEDRYQNAIDLHDELQAFVYTAGEFYSRKDLAGWMKKTFAKEIEEETAKLESYRQLKPPAIPESLETDLMPPPVPAAPARGGTQSKPLPRKPPPITKPPPPPASRSQPIPVAQPASPSRSQAIPAVSSSGSSGSQAVPLPTAASRSQAIPVAQPASRSQGIPAASRSQAIPVVQPPSRSQPITINPPSSRSQAVAIIPPPSRARTRSQPVAVIPPPGPVSGPRTPPPPPGDDDTTGQPHRPGPSSWDDDDLETRIYADDDKQHKSNRANLPLQPPASSPGIVVAPDYDGDAALSPAPSEWPPDVSIALVPRTRSASGGARRGRTAPPTFPNGSSNAPSPLAPERLESNGREPAIVLGREPSTANRELSAPNRLVAAAPTELPYEPRSAPISVAPPMSFGARIAARQAPSDRQRMIFTVGVGVAAFAAITVIIIMLASGRSKPPAPPPAPAVKPSPVVAADPSTGFDLYVTPAGITQWKLDGESRTDRLPSRIRGIAPGPHAVQIDPPPGFLSQHQQVAVELGKAPRVEITLQPITGITGVFESVPPGATVSLIVDGKRQTLGPSPAKASLDPRSSYQVLFEKPGYVSVNRPIAFSGGLEERVLANLEATSPPPAPRVAPPPAPPATTPPPAAPSPPRETHKAPSEPAPDKPDRAEAPAEGKAQGVLTLGSKPPCDITIDGSPTGLHTPQKELKLSVGRHRVVLTNTEFNIKDSFTVDIKADAPEKLIKDYSDQLPK